MQANEDLLKEYQPCPEEAQKYLKKWDGLTRYVWQEKSLNILFQTFQKNDKIENVLIKCSALNDFYSANIFSTYSMAKHILDLKIDKRIEKGDISIVNEIAKLTISGKEKNFYSFASKYCSHHFPEKYPIYDRFVEKVLMYFKQRDSFAKFKKADLKDYPKFVAIINAFKSKYNLNKFSFKELDRYLWLLGKEAFSQS